MEPGSLELTVRAVRGPETVGMPEVSSAEPRRVRPGPPPGPGPELLPRPPEPELGPRPVRPVRPPGPGPGPRGGSAGPRLSPPLWLQGPAHGRPERRRDG